MEHLQALTEIFKHKGAVALLPTETVYGLVCRYDDEIAKEKIFQMKAREGGKLLQVFVRDLKMLETLLGEAVEARVKYLIQKYCPGPLMLIVKKKDGSTVGFRIPDNQLILTLLDTLNVPLCATSANRSKKPNARHFKEARDSLLLPVDYGVDSGEILDHPQASTIIDLTTSEMRCLREGVLSFDEIKKSLDI